DRVEHTFRRQDLLGEILSLAFGERLAGLLIMLGVVMSQRTTEGEGEWTSDSVAYDAAVFAAMRLLEYGRPDGSRASPFDYDNAAHWVEEFIESISGGRADEILGRDARVDAMLRMIGPIATRMSDALTRMRGQTKRSDSHGRKSSRK